MLFQNQERRPGWYFDRFNGYVMLWLLFILVLVFGLLLLVARNSVYVGHMGDLRLLEFR